MKTKMFAGGGGGIERGGDAIFVDEVATLSKVFSTIFRSNHNRS